MCSPLRAQQVNVKEWATGSVLVAALKLLGSIRASKRFKDASRSPGGARCVSSLPTTAPVVTVSEMLDKHRARGQARIENMKMMTASLWSEVTDNGTGSETVRIEFDGGSTCNIPRLGYGQGYGSYRIGAGKVQRVNFGECMSANCAEILTLLAAITEAKTQGAKRFLVVGDSMIALKWANVATGKRKATKITKTSPGFQQAIVSLYQVADGIQIDTQWQPRE